MEWAPEQVTEVCRLYSLNGITICPACSVAVEISKGPDGEDSKRAVTLTCRGCGASTTQTFMTLDPKDFIRSPYTTCSSCSREGFGLLMVSPRGYTKRCADCRATRSYKLPPLEKKLVYLDQLAISNLMFALNPDTKQYREGRVDPFWRTIFEKLDRLAKLQLIACPETEIQEQESLVHPRFTALRRVYEQFSGRLQFMDSATVERFQIQLHALNWIDGRPAEPPQLSRGDVLHGDPSAWRDILQVAARGRVTEEDIAALRAHRDSVGDGIRSIFARWQVMKDFRFRGWFAFEVGVTGRQILETFGRYTARWAELQAGSRPLSLEDAYTPPEVLLVTRLHGEFMARSLSADDASARLRDYLTSPAMVHVHSIKISAMLWTAIVRQAAIGGRKRPPSSGVVNDIKLLATILPYCDALFIDNEMRRLLLEEPLASELQFGARIFSWESRREFVEYLNGIENAASAEHMALACEVYGEERLRPYTEMFDAAPREG